MAVIQTCDRCGKTKKEDELSIVTIRFTIEERQEQWRGQYKESMPAYDPIFSACLDCRMEIFLPFKYSKPDAYDVKPKE